MKLSSHTGQEGCECAVEKKVSDYYIFPRQGELVSDISAGDGKIANLFFYSVLLVGKSLYNLKLLLEPDHTVYRVARSTEEGSQIIQWRVAHLKARARKV